MLQPDFKPPDGISLHNNLVSAVLGYTPRGILIFPGNPQKTALARVLADILQARKISGYKPNPWIAPRHAS